MGRNQGLRLPESKQCRMITFRHSGDVGDIIYGLPTIIASGGGSLYVSKRMPTWITVDKFKAFVPLAVAQPYIHDARWDNRDADVDLDAWRRNYCNGLTIADMTLRSQGKTTEWRNAKWLYLNHRRELFEVLLHRSPRYHNDNFPWARVVQKYGPRAAFVGLPEEHDVFCRTYGLVPYVPTPDLLALAEIINGCRLFIGNQSAPFAIAEGLKKPVVLEVCPSTSNCVFERPRAIHGTDRTVLLPEIS